MSEEAVNPYQQMMEEAYSKMEPLNKQQLDDRANQEREETSLKLPKSTEHVFDDATYQLLIEAVKTDNKPKALQLLGVKE